MSEMKIIGIGAITKLGTDIETIWDNLNEENEDTVVDKIKFNLQLDSSKKRRMSRYSQMAVYSAMEACRDCNLEINEENTYRVGTIYTTGYGPIVSNFKFAEMLEQGDPDLCSPTVFACTVSNTCVGEICVTLQCRGVSTLVMGSDNLAYSNMLLNKGDADYILTGAVEEYCEDLYHYFREKGKKVNESAVSLIVTNDDAENYYAVYEYGDGCNVQNHTYLNDEENNKAIQIRIQRVIERVLGENKVDAVFFSNENEKYNSFEQIAIQKLISYDVAKVNKITEIVGDTLGASYNLSAMLAALCIKKGKLPKRMGDERTVNKILVLGTDVSGNYMASMVRR